MKEMGTYFGWSSMIYLKQQQWGDRLIASVSQFRHTAESMISFLKEFELMIEEIDGMDCVKKFTNSHVKSLMVRFNRKWFTVLFWASIYQARSSNSSLTGQMTRFRRPVK